MHRACSRSLLVLDDQEFYEAQNVLRLEQFRAIAAALNTLVYSSHVTCVSGELPIQCSDCFMRHAG